MSIATTIFKIRAWSDYLSKEPYHVSFRRGQAFYALSINMEKRIYFVSTQYSTPFARTAVCGLVPMEYFDVEELYGNPPPLKAARRAATKSLSLASKTEADKENMGVQQNVPKKLEAARLQIRGDAIKSASVIDHSYTNNGRPSYQLRVSRHQHCHIIHRTFDDFILMHNGLLQIIPAEISQYLPRLPEPIINSNSLKQAGAFEARVQLQRQQLTQYVASFFKQMPKDILEHLSVCNFFDVKNEMEATNVSIRRPTFNQSSTVTKSSLMTTSMQSMADKASQRLKTIIGGDLKLLS